MLIFKSRKYEMRKTAMGWQEMLAIYPRIRYLTLFPLRLKSVFELQIKRCLLEGEVGVDRAQPINQIQIFVSEVQIFDRADAIDDLRGLAGSDDCSRHAGITQNPGNRHLCQRLASVLG